ncbi:ester cyclase [Citrobacter sp. DNRA3]|uniref:ester cyclase n=1 Tax=Citrobacter sp. DNRA3 TaxID=2723054 RepID=UPI0014596B6E|nr:ester cyclase [Citrobacter sp. DNRA3]NBJ27863.1 ester cyclase [Citrobacter freundii]NMD74139.1 ester cyclase [Citrobacter sp. DNRA3]
MITLKIAVLSLVMFSGYSLAESTSLNTIKEYMAAWNAHDASRAAQFLADDAVYYDAAAGEPINGREKAEKEVIGAFIKAVPDLSWKMVGKPVYDEDTVAFRWEFSGKNSGEWAGSPPTNNPIKFEGVSYIHVKAGKITWQGDYYDSKKLDEELKPVK